MSPTKKTCPPDKKRERLADSGGLYLEIVPNGSKHWFWKYRKEGRMALGRYPDVSLATARKAMNDAREVKDSGFDPVQARKAGHLSSAELRYLRMSRLKMSQAGVDAVLGVDAQTVARWEKGEGAPMTAEKLLRVMYLAHSKGDAPVRSVVESINTIERAMHPTIMLYKRQGLWEATTKDVGAQQDAVA